MLSAVDWRKLERRCQRNTFRLMFCASSNELEIQFSYFSIRALQLMFNNQNTTTLARRLFINLIDALHQNSGTEGEKSSAQIFRVGMETKQEE